MSEFKSLKIFSNPHFLLTLAALFWGFNAIAGRSAVGELSPLLIVSSRWLGVLVILTILCRNEISSSFKEFKKRSLWFLVMGLLGFTGFNSLYYVSAHHTVAINLGIVQSTMPAFIIIISMIWLKTKVNSLQILGLMITFMGVLVVITNGNINYLLNFKINKGDLIMVFACPSHKLDNLVPDV